MMTLLVCLPLGFAVLTVIGLVGYTSSYAMGLFLDKLGYAPARSERTLAGFTVLFVLWLVCLFSYFVGEAVCKWL